MTAGSDKKQDDMRASRKSYSVRFAIPRYQAHFFTLNTPLDVNTSKSWQRKDSLLQRTRS